MEYEGILLFSFCGVGIAWIPNKTSQKYKSQTNIPQQILSKLNPAICKKVLYIIHQNLVECTQECKIGLTYKNQINVTRHINRIKDKNPTITSVETEKALNKNWHLFMFFIIKTTEQTRKRKGLLQPDKGICVRSKACIMLDGEMLSPYDDKQDKDACFHRFYLTLSLSSDKEQLGRKKKSHPDMKGRNRFVCRWHHV